MRTKWKPSLIQNTRSARSSSQRIHIITICYIMTCTHIILQYFTVYPPDSDPRPHPITTCERFCLFFRLRRLSNARLQTCTRGRSRLSTGDNINDVDTVCSADTKAAYKLPKTLSVLNIWVEWPRLTRVVRTRIQFPSISRSRKPCDRSAVRIVRLRYIMRNNNPNNSY